MKYSLILLFLVLNSFSCTTPPQPVTEMPAGRGGKVVAVKDGDTIEILTRDAFTISIRLDEIDCPEKRQAFGQAAKQFTSDFCFGKFVTVKGSKKDGYGRLLAFVYNEKGECLNEALLKNGLAWQYIQYSKSAALAEIQREARLNKRGLWVDPHALAPWEFRVNAKNKPKKIKP